MIHLSRKTLRIFTHTTILCGLLLFQFFPLIWGISFPYHYWIKQSLFCLIWVGVFYSNLYFLVPRLLHNHKAVLYFISVVILLIVMVIINHQVDEALQIKARLIKHFHLKDSAIGKESDIISDSFVLIITLLLVGCSTVMGVTDKMQKDALLRKDLQSDKVSAELAFLKAQINPHFLFNTLNSIFVLTSGNEQAHQAVYNLSKMMRYVLYETEGRYTTLSKEIVLLKEYLSLMQLRLTDNVKVAFTAPDNLQDHEIAPMMLLPIVENAFKHGISGVGQCEIKFDLAQQGTGIIFSSENRIFSGQAALEDEKGIGIANTRRRLELLYAGNYSLDAGPDTSANIYRVVLKINLS